MLQVEVIYARARAPARVSLTVTPGTTLRQVIEQSGLPQRYPEINLAKCAIGSFGKIRKPDELAVAGDRIEIYRPLAMDPKDRRRLRSTSSSA